MAPDSLIVQFFGTLILALLTGTWSPGPPELISLVAPAPVTFSAQWHPNTTGGDATATIIILADGTARMGMVSASVGSAVSPQPSKPAAGG